MKQPLGGAPPTGAASADMDYDKGLLAPIGEVKGVGPKIARALEKRGIRTIEDLIYFVPSRYEDKRLIRKIAEIVEGEESVLLGRVVDSGQA